MSHRCFLGRIPRLFLLLSSGPIWAGPVLTLSGLSRVPRAEQRDFGSCVRSPLCPAPHRQQLAHQGRAHQ